MSEDLLLAMRRIYTLIVLCLAASTGFGEARYTVSGEDAAGPGTPKVVVLRDTVGGLEAAVAPSQGGELSSFRVKFKGEWVELLYRARDYNDTKGFHSLPRDCGIHTPGPVHQDD